jgi:Spy/CpxP family protein refolding chaperone
MLRNRQELGLTSAQVTELERLRNEFEREGIRLEADAQITEMELADLLRKDPVDLIEVEAKVRQSERLRAELRVARIRVIERGKGQLDAEQKSRLQDLLASFEPSWARPERRTMPAPPGRPRSF